MVKYNDIKRIRLCLNPGQFRMAQHLFNINTENELGLKIRKAVINTLRNMNIGKKIGANDNSKRGKSWGTQLNLFN